MGSTGEDALAWEREWLGAILRKDARTLERILAPDFVYTASGHGRSSRQQWLELVATSYDIQHLEFGDAEVRVYGDVALVLARIRQQATLAGVERTGEFLVMDVWVRGESRWQVTARSSIQAV
jgi:ketosteroid isomerase-like protein